MKYLHRFAIGAFGAKFDRFGLADVSAGDLNFLRLTVSIAAVGWIDTLGSLVLVDVWDVTALSMGAMSDNISMKLGPSRLTTFWWPSMLHTSSEELLNRARKLSISVGMMATISMILTFLRFMTNCSSLMMATSMAPNVNFSRRFINGSFAIYSREKNVMKECNCEFSKSSGKRNEQWQNLIDFCFTNYIQAWTIIIYLFVIARIACVFANNRNHVKTHINTSKN